MKEAAMLLLMAGLVGCDARKPDPFPPSDEEIALGMQCHDRHGLLAVARGDRWTWVSCRQGKKKIWSVRLAT